MAASSEKTVLKRFMFDLEELRKSPDTNVSATPLEENMFEWHCNIRQEDIIFHLILFFPKNYPYRSPSAEFVPSGFQYHSGATKPGKKGTQVCLNIFSDFSDIHTEWKDEKGLGWSPGYTVQTILMNVVAFLSETQAGGSSSQSYKQNLLLSKDFKCADCGHTYDNPFPKLDSPETEYEDKRKTKKNKNGNKKSDNSSAIKSGAKKNLETSDVSVKDELKESCSVPITDYISKDKFTTLKPCCTEDLWGYGLAISGTAWRPTLTSPCEFITARSFYGMLKEVKIVHSVLKEQLKLFLPLYIHPKHGSEIKNEFEKTLREVAKIMPNYDPNKTPMEDLVLKTLPNLMSATVVEFSKGTMHTSDNSLNGYFALHRLLLWAIDTYPRLQDTIEEQVKVFVDNESNRTKEKVPYIAEWLMLVAGSLKYRWSDVAGAYLSESWKRNVIWYVKDDAELGMLDTAKEYRIKRTFQLTEIARKHLAFQACFLSIAMPEGMSREDVVKRYDENFGFPTPAMVATMKENFTQINTAMNTYQDWFEILKLPTKSDDDVYAILVDAVRFSIVTPGYHWSNTRTGGGWGKVLTRYAQMRSDNTGINPAKEQKKDKSTARCSKAEKTQEELVPQQRQERGKEKSPRGKKPATGRGRKRKVSDDIDDGDDDDDEELAKRSGKRRIQGKKGACKRRF